MLSEEQLIEKINRIEKTVKLFLKNPSRSDIELANLLNQNGTATSSSTVGRDLTSKMIVTIFDEKTYERVLLQRKYNLLEARRKGGLHSQENNDYLINPETGKFMGSRKK